jgi:hypothetical protein
MNMQPMMEDDMAGGRPMQPMMRNKEAKMEKAEASPAPAPAKANAEKRDTKTEGLQEEKQSDFMLDVKQNTRWYSHQRRVGWSADERIDMTETVLFQAAKEVKAGKVSGSFQLSDLVTQFRISASAFGTNGQLGYKSLAFQAAKPFYIQYELPSSFLVGDKLFIDVIVNNFYAQDQQVTLSYVFSDEALKLKAT